MDPELSKALGLPAGATTADGVAAIAALNAQISDLKVIKKGLPAGVDPEDVHRRMSAGLSKSDAITAAQNQAEADLSRKSEAAPDEAAKPKGKGK